MLSTVKNKYQKLSFFGLKYVRIITDSISASEIEDLKSKYSYIVIYSYEKPIIDNFIIRTQTISVINLSQNLDDIFNKFRKDTRTGIKKISSSEELKIKITNDINESYEFYKKVKKTDAITLDLKREFKNCLFFNAYWNNNLIVSASYYDTGKILREKHLVSLRKEFDSRTVANATRKLKWEAIEYAKKNGYEKFDLAGANMTDLRKKGIAEFKQSFGGDMVDSYILRYETRIFKFVKKILKLLNLNIN